MAASQDVTNLIKKMVIDEDGLLKVKGKKNETDHNTISLELKLPNIDSTKVVKKTDWNLRASSEQVAYAKKCESLV